MDWHRVRVVMRTGQCMMYTENVSTDSHLNVVNDEHGHAEPVHGRALGVPAAEGVVLGEDPHVPHDEPNEAQRVDDVAHRVYVLVLLRPLLEPLLAEVHNDHHCGVCKHAQRAQGRPILPLRHVLHVANTRLVPVLRQNNHRGQNLGAKDGQNGTDGDACRRQLSQAGIDYCRVLAVVLIW